MTQEELARKLGIDPGTLGYWERGERRPSMELAEKLKILLFLGIPLIEVPK